MGSCGVQLSSGVPSGKLCVILLPRLLAGSKCVTVLSMLMMFRGRLSSPQHRNVKLAPSYHLVGVGVSDPAGNASMLDPCSLASSFPRTDSAAK